MVSVEVVSDMSGSISWRSQFIEDLYLLDLILLYSICSVNYTMLSQMVE